MLRYNFDYKTYLPNDEEETTYALPEKTKRGPPTNRNIPVRNMKAQIANMSLNENAGFKSEYHVRYIVSICFLLLIFVVISTISVDEEYMSQIHLHFRTYLEGSFTHA